VKTIGEERRRAVAIAPGLDSDVRGVPPSGHSWFPGSARLPAADGPLHRGI